MSGDKSVKKKALVRGKSFAQYMGELGGGGGGGGVQISAMTAVMSVIHI